MSQAQIMSCFILVDGKRAAFYTGLAYFGTLGEVIDQLGDTKNAGSCVATQTGSTLANTKNITDSRLSQLNLVMANLEKVALEFS
jgi:hypothetical protein